MEKRQATEVIIELPRFWEDEDVEEYFRDINFGAGHVIEAALDLDVSDIEDRAQLYDTSITEIELDEESISITYELSYEVYLGCRDLNYADIDERHLCGKREGNRFTFPIHFPPPKRSTYEEF